MAVWTRVPHAIMPTSGVSESKTVIAFPISKGVALVVKDGVPALPNRKYAGLPDSAIASVAFRASSLSQGTMTAMFGMVRMRATSSKA